mmetsp:Transcript_26724/g.62269  ORF Transcript_26724/g.62269 Transcript_26724/m.62269 type:complete len:368 (-) Transcript_26724:61-1164(-)
MVEVGHDDLEALVLLTKQEGFGHNCSIVADESSTCRTGVLRLDNGGHNFVRSGHQQHGDASSTGLPSADSRHKPISIHATGDPLLCALHHVVVTTGLSTSSDAGDIAACKGLADGEDCNLLTTEDLWDHLLLHPFGAVLQDHWDSNDVTTAQPILEARAEWTSCLLIADHLVEVVKLLGLHCTPHEPIWSPLQVLSGALGHCNETCITTLLSKGGARGLVRLLALQSFWHHLLGDELAQGLPQDPVRLLEVWRFEALLIGRLGERHARDGSCVGLLLLLSWGICQPALLQTLVLVQNISSVQAIEVLCGILASCIQEHLKAAWVHLGKLGDIVDISINDDPAIVRSVVLRNFLLGECGSICSCDRHL